MKGKVKNISVQNRSALISYTDGEETVEKWFSFGDKVKMTFVKKGDCEFEIDKDDEDSCPFIKCSVGEAKKETKDFKPATEFTPERKGFDIEWDKVKQQRISRSGLINSAIAFFEANRPIKSDGIREVISEEQVIETAKKFEAYISEE